MSATLYFNEVSILAKRFRTGISLHSHTSFSRETLGFVYQYARGCRILDWAVRRGERQYQKCKGHSLDFAKAFWTPPVAPREAVELESAAIRGYGLDPLVSLTDHDTIEAAKSLSGKPGHEQLPISVEWTIPYGETFFHLGIHNLPASRAEALMAQMSEFTANRDEESLRSVFEALSRLPEVLVVFNHPCWDEKAVGKALHRSLANQFIAEYGDFLHAFEVNGLRPWPENEETIQVSREIGKPLISGGDRHGLTANTILNFTRAETFGEFVSEVHAGHSHVVFTPGYWEDFRLRLLGDMQSILSVVPGHGFGWKRWEDRVFFACADGAVRPLSIVFGGNIPAPVQVFVAAVEALKHPVLQYLLERFWAGPGMVNLRWADAKPQTFHTVAARHLDLVEVRDL